MEEEGENVEREGAGRARVGESGGERVDFSDIFNIPLYTFIPFYTFIYLQMDPYTKNLKYCENKAQHKTQKLTQPASHSTHHAHHLLRLGTRASCQLVRYRGIHPRASGRAHARTGGATEVARRASARAHTGAWACARAGGRSSQAAELPSRRAPEPLSTHRNLFT